jgi:TRAP-type C4-dicarboxylate transport system substrate-binding protein
MVTSPSTGADSQAWDYVNHFTEVSAWIPKNIVVVNKRAFRRLDKASQEIILDAAANAESAGWAGVAARAAKDKATLIANGMTVSQPSPELIKELKAIGKTMSDEWKAEAPKDVAAILYNYEK